MAPNTTTEADDAQTDELTIDALEVTPDGTGTLFGPESVTLDDIEVGMEIARVGGPDGPQRVTVEEIEEIAFTHAITLSDGSGNWDTSCFEGAHVDLAFINEDD